MKDQGRRLLMYVVLPALILTVAGPAWALREGQPWDLKTRTGPDAEVPGWFINLGITGVRAKIAQDEPKIFLVMHVFENTPASGKLEKGDKILGVNGTPFTVPHKFGYGAGKFGYEGPWMEFGDALDECQSEAKKGRLKLKILREGKEREVELQLPTRYGSFAKTYPFECKKTDLILQDAYGYLLKRQKGDGSWHGRPHINAFAALALLGSGNPEYLPAVKKAVQAMARGTDRKINYGGLSCWRYALYGIALGEYYLITREAWVLPELEEINGWLSEAQSPATAAPERVHIEGGFGHNAYNSKEKTNGYGGMCITTGQSMLAWALMKRCGLEVDEGRFRKAHQYIAKGTNKIGYVWYADGSGGRGYADMGRTGISALAHQVSPFKDPAYLEQAKLNAQCIGEHPDTFPDTHACPLLGTAWEALGAAAVDPAAFRKLMDANRWCFSLAHCPDGTFYYQPNRDNNPQDYTADPRLSATAVMALVLSVRNKKLQITGAPLSDVKTPAQLAPKKEKESAAREADEAPPKSLTVPKELVDEYVKRFVGKLVAILKDGTKVQVYLRDWGPQPARYQLQEVNESALIVSSGDNMLPVPWRLLSPTDRAGLAKSIARDEDAETLLIAAVLFYGAGRSGEGELFLARAERADAEAAKALRSRLATR